MSLKESVRNIPKETLTGIAAGGIGAGISEAGARTERAIFPQAFKALEQGTKWYRYLTSIHGESALYLEHEPISGIAVFTVIAVFGAIIANGLDSKAAK